MLSGARLTLVQDGQLNPPGPWQPGTLLADVTGDKRPQIVASDAKGVEVYSAQTFFGHGYYFAHQTLAFPYGTIATAADIDGDGRAEIVTFNRNGLTALRGHLHP